VELIGGHDGTSALADAEIFDPALDAFSRALGRMSAARVRHLAVLLGDGRVLVVGGGALDGTQAPQTTELFNPATGTFSAGPPMRVSSRIGFAGARLADGRVLYCGGCSGSDCGGPGLDSCEIYTPERGGPGTLALTGSLNVPSAHHAMVTLGTGQVLLVGGVSGGVALARAERFDAVTGRFTMVGALAAARADAALALLTDGRVLVAGGRRDLFTTGVVATGEIFDPGRATASDGGGPAPAGGSGPVDLGAPGLSPAPPGLPPAPPAAGCDFVPGQLVRLRW
jgi:hypothetical protein